MSKKIGIASDHAGKDLKQLIVDLVRLTDNDVVDYGVSIDSDKSVDYPDYAGFLAQDISSSKLDLAIAICGTGIGMSIAANKFSGVRAAVVWDEFSAKMAKAHNNANILCLGARSINHHRASEMVKIWLSTKFEGDRHQMRLDKIREIEKKNHKPRS